ncbi:MAG: glycerate kinase [Desulfatiglandaceae bacterium]|jgi:hydroxypyruvate reductase
MLEQLRNHAQDIFRASLEAVDPYEAVKRFVHLEGKRLSVGQEAGTRKELELDSFDRILVVGGGKATAPMAAALENILGSRIRQGTINVKYGFTRDLSRIGIVEAGHPLPDENGVLGTQKILGLLNGAGEKDLIFSLISGGGSALLPQPAGAITLEEKQAMTRTLLECGASIDEINALRKHISSSKGGQMARAAYPATTINLMLSDVVGDRIDVIASGPFVPDTSTFETVTEILDKYGLRDLPPVLEAYLKAGVEGEVPETPKQGDEVFDRVFNCIVGSNILALKAAKKKAASLGYETLILSSMVEGETREVARVHTAIALEILKTGHPLSPPACVISGGETTVTIRGSGVGGRNQEFCLAAAMDLGGIAERVVILSGGTDGNDGPTEAAGGIVDPLTLERAREAEIKALDFLKANNAYAFLKKTGDLLITGPTNTNVMDVRLVLVG